jgi:hypothetical protein
VGIGVGGTRVGAVVGVEVGLGDGVAVGSTVGLGNGVAVGATVGVGGTGVGVSQAASSKPDTHINTMRQTRCGFMIYSCGE